ncbi:hypothetical protein O181_038555 [Austropuccinia psidii MF-1]|uniref:CCHC-type domain-containing protein n=1 Tax=Austropuccinia psidii MF-1 TaxID=1389203 RepID=A0A9Q3DA05_9BASI|nr:hypothetical protein [Austropuccinia psidii MF-1]
MKEIHGRRSSPWWKTQIVQKYINDTCIWKNAMSFETYKYSVDRDPYEWCIRQSKRLKAIDPQMNIQMRNHKLLTHMPGELEHSGKPRERVAEVKKKKNSCHNCGSTDHYANNCLKAKKKVYAIEKVPEEESPTGDSESESMGDAIREHSDEEQEPREELLVEYQEETPLEIQDIQFEEGKPQDTEKKNLCKHTQDAKTFLATPTKRMA